MQNPYQSSSNPRGIYTPEQQQMARMQQMSSVQRAFAPSEQLIGTPDYKNYGNLIHNNVGDKVFNEYLTEYKVHVSSADRDTTTYPNPFNMRVVFGNEHTSPHIYRKFKTIKYVSIDSVVIPRTIAIDTSFINLGTKVYDIYPTGTSYTTNGNTAKVATNNMTTLANRRYLILKIIELGTDQNLGTSIWYDKDTILLTPDYTTGFDNVVWKPLHNSKVVFPTSNVQSLSNLTFTLYDENGTLLTLYDNSGNVLIGSGVTAIGGTDYNTYVSTYSSTASVSYTAGVEQLLYNITFGVVDCEITTQTKFQ